MMAGAGMMMGWGWLGMIVTVLLLIGIVVLIVWGLSNLTGAGRGTGEQQALDILRQRHARSEISREAFLHARDVLR